MVHQNSARTVGPTPGSPSREEAGCGLTTPSSHRFPGDAGDVYPGTRVRDPLTKFKVVSSGNPGTGGGQREESHRAGTSPEAARSSPEPEACQPAENQALLPIGTAGHQQA
jgi:hypothetical protein